MSFQSLNEDALAAIVSHLDASDARRLSLTTRAVYILAKYQSLTSVAVHSFENTVIFCRYFLADMRHRFSALRTLEIHRQAPWLNIPPSGEEKSAAARLLADVLAGATNLQRLVLTNAEAWITHDHHIADAISSMTHLAEIELEGLGHLTSDMISKLRSQPRKLSLTETTRLSYLTSSGFYLSKDVCLPSVQRLMVTEYAVYLITLADCARVFPNVRWADLGSLESRSRPFGILTWNDAVGHQTVVEWPLLEHLRGPTADIRNSAFVVPIHSVEITTKLDPDLGLVWFADEDSERDERLQAVMIVRSSQPVALLASAHSDIADDFWLMFVTSSGRLRYLSVTLYDIRVSSHSANKIYAWWEKFVPVAARTNIICLKVQCDSRLDTNPSWDPTTGRPCAGPSDMVGAIMTMTMFPTLAKSVPSLRYLCVHVPAHPNCSSPLESLVSVSEDDEMRASTYWWKLRGPGDDRVAERLDAAIGERVAAYMSSARYDYTKDLDETSDAI